MAAKVFNTNEAIFDGVYAHDPNYPIESFESWDDAIEFAEGLTTDRLFFGSPYGNSVLVRDEETGRQELVHGDQDEADRRRKNEERKKKNQINDILCAARENGGRVDLSIERFAGSTAESGWLKHEAQTQQYVLVYDGCREYFDEGECLLRLRRFKSVDINSSGCRSEQCLKR